MSNHFVWFELCTADVAAAQRFYGDLVGWDVQPSAAAPELDYRVFSAAGKPVAGLMPLPDGMSQPFWLGYIGVPDCDAAVAQATAAGATLHRVMDIPEIGKIALISDPQGAGYAMIQGYGDAPSEAFDQARPGHGNWTELYTTDLAAAVGFYAGQYGWTKGLTMPMGAMGDYQIFQADGADIGGMMKAPEGLKLGWLFYFGVPDIDAAAACITANGGTIRHGPAEVPGGAFIIQYADPQGAMAAVTGPRK